LRDRFFNDQQRGKSNFSGISSNDLLCVENYSFQDLIDSGKIETMEAT
jgi:hypothetical protein